MARKGTKTRVALKDEPESEEIVQARVCEREILKDHASAIHCSFVQLCAWWAIWSVYDTYLLKYTPVSEIVMLLICIPLYLLPLCLPTAWNRTQNAQQSIQRSLERI